MKVSLVIPFHNEEENLKILCPLVLEMIKKSALDYEVQWVDDGSTDSSCYVVSAYSDIEPSYRLIKNAVKSGQTNCFNKAFPLCRGEYIIRMDSDLQDNPEDLPKFDKAIEKGYDIIIAYRTNRQHATVMIALTRTFDFIINLYFKTKLKSNSGSFIAFKAEYLKNLNLIENDHRYLPLIAINRGAVKILTIDVDHQKRLYGKSKYGILKKIVYGIPEVIKFIRRLESDYYKH
jgi:glycosyltransferase involved in cell wall biosynthesis